MPTEKVVTISRNPFAREDLVRETIPTMYSCYWCGTRRKSGKMFHYGTQPDSWHNRVFWHEGVFCSIGCHDSYHDK